MASNKPDYLFKVLLIGSSNVGKTSLLMRFADQIYQETYISTIGVDFRFRTVIVDGKKISLQIWDTAGQERFKSIVSSYYHGADGVIICYDITDMDSFEQMENWMGELNSKIDGNVIKLIVGNKADKEDERLVSESMAEQFAHQNKCNYIETSAKTSTSVDTAFLMITHELIKMRQKQIGQIGIINQSPKKNNNSEVKCCK